VSELPHFDILDRRKKPHYDWMHPSWRDLVIDYLAGNPKVRLDFLGCSGPHGIQIALSRGGGTRGERQRPLLVTSDDWRNVSAAIKTQMTDGSERAVHAILASLLEATLHYPPSKDHSQSTSHQFLYDIVRDAISVLCDRWNSSDDPLPLDTLEIYQQLSEQLEPLPPMPRLKPTWLHYWTKARNELNELNEDLISTYQTGKWIDLQICISASEPRLLKQVDFPDCCIPIIENFLERVTSEVRRKRRFFAKREYEEALEILSEVKIIDRMGQLFPSLESAITIISQEIDLKRLNIEKEMAEEYPEGDYDLSGKVPSGGIGIDEIMSDL
jgi:hypothetical protein